MIDVRGALAPLNLVSPPPESEEEPLHPYLMITRNGQSFVVVPQEEFKRHQKSDKPWIILSCLGGLSLLVASIAVLIPALRPPAPVIVEKQVPTIQTIEKPVPVNTNCLAWCK
jgi:hypothetical protein